MEISDYKIVKIKLVKTVTIKLVVLRNEIERSKEKFRERGKFSAKGFFFPLFKSLSLPLSQRFILRNWLM